jgi:hypothetical protein
MAESGCLEQVDRGADNPTSYYKTIIKPVKGGQGPVWAVAPLIINKKWFVCRTSHIPFLVEQQFQGLGSRGPWEQAKYFRNWRSMARQSWRESHEERQNIRSPGRDLSPGHPEYKVRVPTTGKFFKECVHGVMNFENQCIRMISQPEASNQ